MTETSKASNSFEWHVELREALSRYFSEDEIASLCFDLGLDYDDLAGDSKTKKIVELIEYFIRTERIAELIEKGKNVRPNIAWDKIAAAALEKPLEFEPVGIEEAEVEAREDQPRLSLSQFTSRLQDRRVLGALLVVVAVIAAIIVVIIALPSSSSAPLQLAFTVGNPGQADIHVIEADGSNLRRLLISGDDDDAEPDWSPDGGRIAYQSNHAGNYDIWIIDADGGQKRQLTTSDEDEREPDWSPDGKRILYRLGGGSNTDGELWVMDADGGNQRQLGEQLIGRAPAWSSSGKQVAFMSKPGDTWNIYILDVNTNDVRPLTNCANHCRFPNWSPDDDDRFIVYNETRSADDYDPLQIWRRRADGSGGFELLVEGNTPGRPAWSSEGLIAFNTEFGIEIVDANGKSPHKLPNGDDGWAPDWSR